MVNELWITSLDGICYFHRALGEENYDVTDELLMTGFFSAISNFSFEFSGNTINKLDYQEGKFLFFKQNNLLFIVKADMKSSDSKIKKKIKILQDAFINKFKTELENFDGEITKFELFEEDLDKIFKKMTKSAKWGKGLVSL